MKIASYDFPCHIKGNTFKDKIFKIENVADTISTPIDLTGAEVLMQFKESEDSEMVFEFKTSNNTILLTNAADGELKMVKRTLDVSAGKYIYDLKVTFPGNYIKTFFKGNITIEKNIS